MRFPALLWILGLAAPPLAAQMVAASIADLSLEQLSSIQVVSVAKRSQRLADVAGSVYVITADDIRRSGATTLPEALRLAPNLRVARASASQYAITARSGLDLLANKMLVLLDGRTIYSPLFSGVFWEAQDVLLADVERIEVLSGSGGTLYGSNAFHGVINILTRPAQDTQGTLVRAVAGAEERLVGLRHGAQSGAFAWRLYGREYHSDALRSEAGASLGDATRRRLAGFRGEHGDATAQTVLQAEVAQHRIDQPTGTMRFENAHLLARHVITPREGDQLQWQAYVDRTHRDKPGNVDDTLDTFDFEVQHQKTLAGGVLVSGAGYRHHWDRSSAYNPAVVALVPPDRRLRLWNLFAQHESGWGGSTRVTLGLKAENNTYTGLEWLPNARIAWEGVRDHLFWAAASRVVRLPARVDREVLAPPLVPNSGFDSEVARVYEAGWRGQPAPFATLSATLFRHEFQRLRTFDLDPATRMGTFNNHLSGHLNGLEAWGQWGVSETLRVRAGGTWQHVRYVPDAGTAPLQAAQLQGNDPRHDVKLSASWNPRADVEADVTVRRVGALPQPVVPAYTAVDLRLGWRPRPDLTLAAVVRNANGDHVEWGAAGARAVVPRSAFVSVTWRP